MADNEHSEQPLTFKLITKETKTKHKESDIADDFVALSKSKAIQDDKLIKEHFDIDADVSDSSEYGTRKLTRGTKYKKDSDLVLLSDYESSPSYSSSDYLDSGEEYVSAKAKRKTATAKKTSYPSKGDKNRKPIANYKDDSMEEEEDDYNMYTMEEIRKSKNLIFGAMNDFFQRRPNFIQPKRRAEIDTMKSSSIVSDSDNESQDTPKPHQSIETIDTKSQETVGVSGGKYMYKYIDIQDEFSQEKIQRRIDKQVFWIFSRAFKPEYFWFFYLKEHKYNFLDYLRTDLKSYMTESYTIKHKLDSSLLTADKTTISNITSKTNKKSELPESLVVVRMLSSALLLEELKKAIANFLRTLYKYDIDVNLLQRNLSIMHGNSKRNRKTPNCNRYTFHSKYNFIKYKTLEGSTEKFESAMKAAFGTFENFILRLIRIHKLFAKEYSIRSSVKQSIMHADLKEKGMQIKEWMDNASNITSIEYVKAYLDNLVNNQANKTKVFTYKNDSLEENETKGLEQFYKEREQEKEEQLEDFFTLLGDDKMISANILKIDKYSSLLDYSSNSVVNGEIISERIWEHNYNRLNTALDRKTNYIKNIHLEDELKRFTRNLDFEDIKQVEQKVVHTISERIRNNPVIKSFVYGLYLDHGRLNTVPTSEGKKYMDINHPLINVKRIENKPISEMLLEEGVRWKQVLEAKDKGLVTYNFGFKKEDFIFEQLLNLYREISGEIDHWDMLRSTIIKKACKFMVVEIEQIVIDKLDVVSQKYVCRKVSELIISNYTRNTRLLKSNIDDDLADLDSFKKSEWNKRVCVMMRVSGDEDHLYGAMMTSGNIEHLFLFKHLLYYQKVKSEEELTDIKQNDWNLFKMLMDKYEPDAIIVDSMNITVQDRWEIEHALTLLVNKPKIEPLMGEIAFSPIVCNRFIEPIVRNWGTLADRIYWGKDTGTYCTELAKCVSLGFYFFHTNELTKYFLSSLNDKVAGNERYTTFIDSFISNKLSCSFSKIVSREKFAICLKNCIDSISSSEGVFVNYKLKFAKESAFHSINKLFNDTGNALSFKKEGRKPESISKLYPKESLLTLITKLFKNKYKRINNNDDENSYSDLFSAIRNDSTGSTRALNEANDAIFNNNLYMNKLPYLCPQNGVIVDLFRVPFCKYETYFAILFIFLEHSTKLTSDYLTGLEKNETPKDSEIIKKGKKANKKGAMDDLKNISDFEKIIHELVNGNFTFLNNYMLKRKLVLFSKVNSFSNNYKDILQQLSESFSDPNIERLVEVNNDLYNEITETERLDLLAIFQERMKRFLLFGVTYAIKGEPTTKPLISTNPQNEREFNNYKTKFLGHTLYNSLPGAAEIFKSKLRTFGIKVGKLVSARVIRVYSGQLECVISRQFLGMISPTYFRDKKLDLRADKDTRESELKIEAFFKEYVNKDSIIQTRILGIDTKNGKLILSSRFGDIEESNANTNTFYSCVNSMQENSFDSYNSSTFSGYNMSNINKYNMSTNVNYNNTDFNYSSSYTAEDPIKNYGKKHRIINEKYLDLGHNDDKIENIEKAKLIKTSKENLVRASQNRQCDLFYFKNYTSDQQIREEMKSRQDGSYLVHPHPEHFNRLVVCIKLNHEPLLILRLHVLEEGKTKETILEIGKSLRILGLKNSKIFQSIEDLVYNYILGISEKLLVIRQHKRFRYGTEEEVETNMNVEYKRNKVAAYCLSFSFKRPGVILLSYMIDGNLNVEAIVAEPDGYVFRRQKFHKVDEVVNKFKVDPYKTDRNI